MKSNRREAIEARERFYCTGKPCKHGHLSTRTTADGACVECRAKSSARQAEESKKIREWLNGGSSEKQEKESEPVNKKKRFIPPSLVEVTQYCKQRNNSVDPETFIDFYESKGWMVGKTKMKSWQASVRTWEKRDATKTKPTGKLARAAEAIKAHHAETNSDRTIIQDAGKTTGLLPSSGRAPSSD
jgi:hypothetical protein